jgi:hypothetical protein
VYTGAQRQPEDITEDICHQQHMLLSIVLIYYSWMLMEVGAVGEKQGNSEDDGKAWNRRVTRLVLEEVDPDQCAK